MTEEIWARKGNRYEGELENKLKFKNFTKKN